MGSAYRLKIALAHELAAQEQRLLQVGGTVVEAGEDVAVAIVFGKKLHEQTIELNVLCKCTKNIAMIFSYLCRI